MSGHREAIAEVVVGGDAELGAGLHEAEEGVAAVAAGVAVGAAADLSFGHVGAEVALGAIGMQRDVGAVERHQRLGLVRVQPGEQPIERGEACVPAEDAVEARA